MPYLIPWKRNEIIFMRRQIDQLCDHFFRDLSDRFCQSNLLYDWHFAEGDDHYLLEVELPDLDPKHLEVTILGDMLTIEVKQETTERRQGGAAQRVCSAVRKVRLPERIDPDRVEATYVDGILKVVLPKLVRTSYEIPIGS